MVRSSASLIDNVMASVRVSATVRLMVIFGL